MNSNPPSGVIVSPILLKVLGLVLSLFALGFMAWAGVLWNRSSVIIDNQVEILVQQGISQQAALDLARRFERAERTFISHSARRWHDEAGVVLRELMVRVHQIEEEEDGRD